MILIFEGPDGGGKSTICRLLLQQYDAHFEKFVRHDEPLEMFSKVVHTLNNPHEHGWSNDAVVLDRWHYPSDVLYEYHFTGNRSVLEPIKGTIEKSLNELDAILIYVHAPIEILKARYEQRGDEYVTFKQIAKVAESYEAFMAQTSLRVISIDTSRRTAQECVDTIASRCGLKKKKSSKVKIIIKNSFGPYAPNEAMKEIIHRYGYTEMDTSFRTNEEIIALVEKSKGKVGARSYNTLGIEVVDTSRPWTIDNYDGVETVVYLDEYICIDPVMNYHRHKDEEE